MAGQAVVGGLASSCGGRHGEATRGCVRWGVLRRDGRPRCRATRRRCWGAPVRTRPLLLPLSSAVCSLLGFWRCSRQGGCWHLHRRGLPVRPKPRPLGVHGAAWMLGGGPGGGRRGVRGRSARLGCGRAAMATWVAWLVMFGEAWWFGRGLTPEYITCPVFSGRRWRQPRALFPS